MYSTARSNTAEINKTKQRDHNIQTDQLSSSNSWSSQSCRMLQCTYISIHNNDFTWCVYVSLASAVLPVNSVSQFFTFGLIERDKFAFIYWSNHDCTVFNILQIKWFRKISVSDDPAVFIQTQPTCTSDALNLPIPPARRASGLTSPRRSFIMMTIFQQIYPGKWWCLIFWENPVSNPATSNAQRSHNINQHKSSAVGPGPWKAVGTGDRVRITTFVLNFKSSQRAQSALDINSCALNCRKRIYSKIHTIFECWTQPRRLYVWGRCTHFRGHPNLVFHHQQDHPK